MSACTLDEANAKETLGLDFLNEKLEVRIRLLHAMLNMGYVRWRATGEIQDFCRFRFSAAFLVSSRNSLINFPRRESAMNDLNPDSSIAGE